MGSHKGSRQIRLGWKRWADAAPGWGSDLRPGHFPRAAQPELLQEPRDEITAREIQHLSWLQQHVANRQRKIPPGASRHREDVSSSPVRQGRAQHRPGSWPGVSARGVWGSRAGRAPCHPVPGEPWSLSQLELCRRGQHPHPGSGVLPSRGRTTAGPRAQEISGK